MLSRTSIPTLVLFGLLAVSLFLVLNSRGESVIWVRDYPAALELADTHDQPVLAYLFTDWCGYCRQMEAETFKDASLMRNMGRHYVWLKLNAEKDRHGIELRRKFAISGYPTILILDSRGEELERIQGFVAPERFQTMVPELLNSPDGLPALRGRAIRGPESVHAQYQLAAKYLERGNLGAAISQFRRVLELNPQDEAELADASRYYLAFALANQKEHHAALSQLALLEERFPASDFVPDSILLRSKIHLYSGNPLQAREALHSFLERYPDHLYGSQVRRLLSEANGD